MLTEMSGTYYKHQLDVAGHNLLLDVLSGIQGKFILSYDDHPEVRKMYKQFNIETTSPIHYSLNNRPNSPGRYKTELLIRNF